MWFPCWTLICIFCHTAIMSESCVFPSRMWRWLLWGGELWKWLLSLQGWGYKSVLKQPVFCHFTRCWKRSRENMVAVWICSVQLANWDQRNTDLRVKAPFHYLCYLATGLLALRGGWLYFCYWPQRRQHFKSVLKIDDEDTNKRRYLMSSNIAVHRTSFIQNKFFFFYNPRVKGQLHQTLQKVVWFEANGIFHSLKTQVQDTVKVFSI